MEMYGDQFTDDFDANKLIVNKFLDATSKKLRNIIAGYITRLVKKQKLAS